MRTLIVGSILLLSMPLSAAMAESQPDVGELVRAVKLLQEQVKELSATVKAQQRIISTLQVQDKAAAGSAPPASAPVAASLPPAGPRGRIPFLPDIGVVGDIVGTVSKTLPDDEGNDRFSAREHEVVFGHDVDPYTRFDATLAFSDTGHTHLEEAYASYWNLPFEMKGRIGRMHQYLGKASAAHRDTLDTVDEPLVVQEYLGEEGYAKTGLDITGFTPLSSDAFTQELSTDGGCAQPARYVHAS